MLTPLLFLRSLSKMLTLLFAATKSCQLTFENNNNHHHQTLLKKRLARKRNRPQVRQISSFLRFHPCLCPPSSHQQQQHPTKMQPFSVFYFLFGTFFAAAPEFAAVACSLERTMLFCQIEPARDSRVVLFASSSSDSSFYQND